MDYAHLIHTYLEGTLEGHLEEVLFAELGRNPLLRRELTAQIQVVSAARRDAASITPTEFEKNAIFSQLGFSTSGIQTEAVALASASAATRLMPSLANLAAMMLGILLLTVGLRSDAVFFPSSGDFLTAQRVSQPTTTHSTAALIATATAARISQPMLTTTRRAAALAFTATSAAQREYSISATQQEHLPSLPDEIMPDANAYLSLPEEADIALTSTSGNVQPMASNIPSVVQKQALEPSIQTISSDNPPKTNVQKTFTTMPKSQVLMPPASLAEALPVRLGIRTMLGERQISLHGMVHYALTPQSAIGFEGGNESATLLRKGAQGGIETMSSDGTELVFSGTAFYRHTFTGLALSKVIVPFVQAGFGVVGKCGALQGMSGLRFDVLPELSFTIAAEVKAPVFYDVNYFQRKTGFSIGLQYHLSGK
ncbi:MAG: hypothetical protein H9535_10260 [Ignavibacteria bacterium]|nr:hypothetical protein [Ignavibacteria bacterium]